MLVEILKQDDAAAAGHAGDVGEDPDDPRAAEHARPARGLGGTGQRRQPGDHRRPADAARHPGEIGKDHYIQWINLVFAIWDKAGNKVYPPQPGPAGAAGNVLWSGFGGRCETDNSGDPITLWDRCWRSGG